jgi:8-oxo-dGTP pyrophosphatase MutT (NUDIX family)
MQEDKNGIRLAGTCVLLRDTDDGVEILLLRRNANLAFAGGAWVFPGGAVDQEEIDSSSTLEEATRKATAREISEECGLLVNEQDLIHFCNWTTPKGEKRRFATWFFVAKVGDGKGDVVIDGGEIHDFRWIGAREAIDLHHSGGLPLMPPTYLSVKLISHFTSAIQACESLLKRESYSVTPRLCLKDGQWICLYPGDGGFEDSNPDIAEPLHRSLINLAGMQYTHSGQDVGVIAMDSP